MVNTKPVGVAYSDPELVSGTTITSATVTTPTVSGGTIDNAVIGGTTAAAGTFTTATAATVTSTGDLIVKYGTMAAAGNSQGTAAALAGGFNLVTGADSTKGVILPTAVAGKIVMVKNNTAGQTLPIYPATGAAINAVAANSAYTIAALTSTILVATSATQWFSIPLVAS